MLDLDAKILPTNFTIRFVAESIDGKDERWDELRATKQLTDVQLIPITGNGYLSAINRVCFTFDSESEPFSVILKVPSSATVDKEFEKEYEQNGVDAEKQKKGREEFEAMLSSVHDREIFFYEHVGNKAQQLHLPKIYAARSCAGSKDLSSACLLMEDLSGKGGLANVCMGLSKGQIESSIVAIADFHAWSLTLPKKLLLDHFQVEPPKKDDEHFETIFVDKLVATGSEYVQKHQGAMRKFLADTPPSMNFEGYTNFGTRPVLSHCDLWVNNIFFKKDAEGKITDELCVFLDWQCPHADTGMSDLGHLILIGASPELKERYLDDWLQLYCDSFADATRRYGVENQYNIGLIHKMWDHHYRSELFFCFVVFAFSYDKANCDEERRSLLDRVESCFEVVRKDFE